MNKSTDNNVPYQGKMVLRSRTPHYTHLLLPAQLDLSQVPIQEPMPPMSPTQATQDSRVQRRSPSSERDAHIGVDEIEPEKKKELNEEKNKNGLKDVVKEHATRKGVKRAKAISVLVEVGGGLLKFLGS
jgi:hypothetical protein